MSHPHIDTPFWYTTACLMIGESNITPQMSKRLERLNELVGAGGGQLRSRQIVAFVIQQCEEDQAKEEAERLDQEFHTCIIDELPNT